MEHKINKYRLPLGIFLIVLFIFIVSFNLYRRFEERSPDRLGDEPKDQRVSPSKAPQKGEAFHVHPQTFGERQKPELTAEDIAKRRSFAKLNLATIYTAQAAFFSDYRRYSTDLKWMGWAPPETSMSSKLGFLREYADVKLSEGEGSQEDPSRLSTDFWLGEFDEASGKRFEYTEDAAKLNLADYATYCKQGCTAGKDFFEMLLILPLGEGRSDVWVINEKKQIKQVIDGLSTSI